MTGITKLRSDKEGNGRDQKQTSQWKGCRTGKEYFAKLYVCYSHSSYQSQFLILFVFSCQIPMKLDLGSLESVRAFCKEVHDQFDKIDILINNAGVFVPLEKQMKTEDGFEFNFGVNHLGHFLMTNLLLDLVKRSAPSR